jgi:hypothetical protein
MKRKFDLLGNVKKNKSKRRKISQPQPQRPTLIFSIIYVKYPQNYEEEYRKIRKSNYDKNISKDDNDDEFENDVDSEEEDNDDDGNKSSDENKDSMKIGENSVSRLIQDGKCKITATVRLYNSGLVPNIFKTFVIETAPQVFLPFIEPYFIYTVEFKTKNNTKWVDYVITKIVDISLSKLGFKKKTWNSNLMYLLSVEMYLGKNQCKKVSNVLQRSSLMDPLSIKNFDHPKLKRFEKRFNNTLYFVYSRATEAISHYKGIIEFDIRKMCNKINYKSILTLEKILNNFPWELAIPTLRERFFIKEFPIQNFRLMENKFNSKFSKNESYRRFPPEYYWALHISHCIHKLSTNGKHVFFLCSNLLDKLDKECRRLKVGSNYSDIVVKEVMSGNCKFVKSNKDVLNKLKSFKYWKPAMKLLTDANYLFLCKKPSLSYTQEKIIGKRLFEVFETNGNNLGRDEWEECVKEQVDELYSKNWNDFENLNPDDRIYIKKVWEIQKECLTQFRFLLLRNIGYNSKIEVPTNYKGSECYTKLNDRQKNSLNQCLSDQPIVICIGLPGTGKTEVIKSFISSLNSESRKKALMILCGVNGITVSVLDQRTSSIFERDKKANRVILKTMTIDMVYAKETYGQGISEVFDISQFETLILDEIQNINMKRMYKLLPLMSGMKRIRLFGDFNQIEPIGIGKIFYKLYEAMGIRFNDIAITELILNNRVRMNPNSMSIVKNFESLSKAGYYDGSWNPVDDDDGTVFMPVKDNEFIDKVFDLYENFDEPTKIHMMSPMRRTCNRLNNIVAERLRLIILRKTGWKESKNEIKFCVRNGRQVIRVGCKIRFGYNYKKAIIKPTNRRPIVSDPVSNGSRAFVIGIQKFVCKFKKDKEDVYRIKLLMYDGKIKNVVIGSRHVDVGDVSDGYFTTIDAMLGGQDKIVIFYLGDNHIYTSPRTGKRNAGIITNLGWVDRRRIMSAISRPSKQLIVAAPEIKFKKKEDLIKIFVEREWKNERVFEHSARFKKSSYIMGPKQLLICMADLKPASRNSDMEKYFDTILSSGLSSSIKPNFMIPNEYDLF